MAAAWMLIDIESMELPNRDDTAREWFAVQVFVRREHFCARHLKQRGYEVFLPCYREIHRWSDRVKRVDRALFSGYVFCRVEREASEKIVTTPGVIRMVSDGGRPLAVAREEIDAIRRVVETELKTEPWQFLQVGQRVRVEAGPLRDTEGIVVRTKNRHRLIISVSLLQRSIAVEIDPNWVSVRPASLTGATSHVAG
jgi:transcription antitermination factor NusG